MILATFEEFVGKAVWMTVIVVAVYGWLAKKFFASHPEAKDAAKKAATDKAISVIGKFLR